MPPSSPRRIRRKQKENKGAKTPPIPRVHKRETERELL
jgi:hypothetical protein